MNVLFSLPVLGSNPRAMKVMPVGDTAITTSIQGLPIRMGMAVGAGTTRQPHLPQSHGRTSLPCGILTASLTARPRLTLLRPYGAAQSLTISSDHVAQHESSFPPKAEVSEPDSKGWYERMAGRQGDENAMLQ